MARRLEELNPDTNRDPGGCFVPVLDDAVASFRLTLFALTLAVVLLLPAARSTWRTAADRLAGLALVVEMLARWLSPEVRESWLHGPNAHLAGRTPAYLIRLGQIAYVIGAIEAEKAGVYA